MDRTTRCDLTARTTPCRRPQPPRSRSPSDDSPRVEPVDVLHWDAQRQVHSRRRHREAVQRLSTTVGPLYQPIAAGGGRCCRPAPCNPGSLARRDAARHLARRRAPPPRSALRRSPPCPSWSRRPIWRMPSRCRRKPCRRDWSRTPSAASITTSAASQPGAADHVLDELPVARCVNQNVVAQRRREADMARVDRDTLVTLRLQRIRHECPFEGHAGATCILY